MSLPSSLYNAIGNIYVQPLPITNGEAAVFTPQGQLIRARQAYTGVLTTGAEWLAAMQTAGYAPAGSAFPSGGAAGISNPTGTQIQIGDATYTRTVLQGTGITQTLNGTTTKWLCEAATGTYFAIYNDGAVEFIGINNMTITATAALVFGAASMSFFGGAAVARPNLSAARTALPASMGAVYVQAEANAVRNLLAAIADALGNATGNNLVRTV
jgi:hypothetical protein